MDPQSIDSPLVQAPIQTEVVHEQPMKNNNSETEAFNRRLNEPQGQEQEPGQEQTQEQPQEQPLEQQEQQPEQPLSEPIQSTISNDNSQLFQYNNHNEIEFDDEAIFPSLKGDVVNKVKFDPQNPELLNHATIKALIVQLTSPDVIDYNLIYDFFITYRMFTDSETIMSLLMTRLIWSLQYLNSPTPKFQTIGQLVLLRTFVVLRHWVLNYFIDDFNNDFNLCDKFSNNINDIIFHSNLIDNSKIFEMKIFKDLKTHWLHSLIEFWQLDLKFDEISKDIINYKIPLTDELSIKNQSTHNPLVKSNTDISIHTNPSYRRSAMLSLYDQNTYHKCLVFDESSPKLQTENPQLSINNLLIQHQSSRQSIISKLDQYNLVKSRKLNHTNSAGSGINNLKSHFTSPLSSGNKHNRMNLNDSSIGLKKTTNKPIKDVKIQPQPHSQPQFNSNDQIIDNNCYQISLNPISIENVGFSTNGNIKLPTSKVSSIVPTTPVKKMDYIIRNPHEKIPQSNQSFESWEKPINPNTITNMDINRKNSIKKILEGWKKNKHHSNKSNEEINKLLNDSIDKDVIGNRVDILSARIIDELEYLIRYYVRNDSYNHTIVEGDTIDNTTNANINHEKDEIDTESLDKSVDIVGSPAKQYSITNSNLKSPLEGKIVSSNLDDSIDEDEVDINDLSELNINKIDNLIGDQGSNRHLHESINDDGDVIKNDVDNDDEEIDLFSDSHQDFDDDKLISPNFASEIHEFSFQRPTSINWNDEGDLEFENSQNQIISDQEINQDLSNNNSMENSELPDPNLQDFVEPQMTFNNNHNNGSRSSTISTPSNITEYDAEIQDLGIAKSPQVKGNDNNTNSNKRISFTTDTTSNNNSSTSATKRFSRNSINSLAKRDSIKSYVSYDSAFSISRDSISETFDGGKNLRKKAGVNNLRTLAGLPSERKSLEIPTRVQSTSSIRKSIRYSAIAALTELPFNDMNNDSKTSLNENHDKRIYRNSVLGDSSIFSVAMKSRNSIGNYSFKTLNENGRISKSSDSFKFISAHGGHFDEITDESTEETNDNESSRQSVAIPGISNGVLKELAAIPDESFHFNPVDFALEKLEGNKNEDSSSTSDITHVDLNNDTEGIMDEINHANTEDIIDTSSQTDHEHDTSNRELTSTEPLEPLAPLTPKGKQVNTDEIDGVDTDSTSIARMIPNSGETIGANTDNDNVFIFSANYTTGSTKQTQNSPESAEFRSPRLILENYNLSNELLTINKVIENNNHISFILSYGLEQLANHFTMIERDILQEIDWKELIELKWNKELTPVNSWLEIIVNEDYYNSNKGVNLVISRFNLMVNWIISEILLTKDQYERVQIISRFIHLGQNCLENQNYSTLMQVLLALTSEKISKLKETWKHLSPGDILLLKNLEELSSPIKNFINLRVSINKIQPSKGCIPFVGLYLSDLIFNTERPKFINNGNDSNKNELINFARFRTSVHIVKSLSQCIEWSSYYKLSVDNELLSKCLYIRSLNEDEMNYCLLTISDP